MLKLATIGVYGFDGDSFLERLRQADVRLLFDVRQRRGVRGPDYAWANSLRLQAALAEAGIGYRHHRELAPTTELRHLQYAEDDRQGVGKRSAASSPPSTPAATRPRYSARPTSIRSWRSCRAAAARRCSASSATPRRVTARWSPSGWPSSTTSPSNT